jgi:hypothetical protein
MEDYDQGMYQGEQDTINVLIRSTREGKFD